MFGWDGLTSEDKASELTSVGVNFLLRRQSVGLLNCQRKDGPQLVRITLKPLQRADRQPTHPKMAAGPGSFVVYGGLRAGFVEQPPTAALQPNPIATGSRLTGQANYVRIRWGCGGAKPHELLADWPQTGASVEVTADNVLVEGICGEDPGLPVPVASVGSEPRFAADLCPSEDRARAEYDALSYAQFLSAALAPLPGDSVGFSVPEFASAVDITLGDLLPLQVAGRASLQVSWLDAALQLLAIYRFPEAPATLAVPEGACTAIVGVSTTEIFETAAWAVWRIAP